MKTYIIYQYIKESNDIQYIEEIETPKEIAIKYNVKSNSIYMYIIESLETLRSKKLLKDKYIIFKDYVIL